MKPEEFRNHVYSVYEKEGRYFPWKGNTTPWGILVSELMLQQTQADRVVAYWEKWMQRWPTPASLCEASLEEVLREWSGLGYNRRARYLKETACILVRNYNGKVPDTPLALETLPGIGPYSAGAIACFAYNYPSVFIETNIRRVMIHCFFTGKESVRDSEIMPLLNASLDRSNPRKWYWALMDYGAALKKQTTNPNQRSAHYTKQSAFIGSTRQIRGSLVRSLVSNGKMTIEELRSHVPASEEKFYKALEALKKELIVAEEAGKYVIC